MGEQFTMPEHGIMCFHCGEVFMEYGTAADHFGADPTKTPGCLLDQVAIEEGGKPERGRGLLMELRKLEEDRNGWVQRALAAEAEVEGVRGVRGVLADFRRRFGTESSWEIWDRFDNERFRADHAIKLLDAAGIPFDQPTPVSTDAGHRPEESEHG